MSNSKDLIHTKGKIKANDVTLAKAFAFYGFDISDYNESFLKAFLRGQVSIINDCKNVTGKTIARINITAGVLDLGNDHKRCNKKIRTTLKDFLQSLKELDMVSMQNQLQQYLKEHFNYNDIEFSFKAHNDQIVITAKTTSDLLKNQQVKQHKFECLIFSYQEAIVNYVYDLQKLEVDIARFKEAESVELKELRKANLLKVSTFKQEQQNALNELNKSVKRAERDKEDEIKNKVTQLENAFNLQKNKTQ